MSATITTPAELDALPAGTVIRDAMETGYAVCSGRGWWGIAGAGSLWESKALLLVLDEPFTVLYRPDAEPAPVTDDVIERAARAYDPEAFEDHPVEQRSHLAAIQWGARRALATEAAHRLVGSGLLASPATITAEQREAMGRALARRMSSAPDADAPGWLTHVDALLDAAGVEVSR